MGKSYEEYREEHSDWCWLSRSKRTGEHTGWSIADDLAANTVERDRKELIIASWDNEQED